MTMLTQEGPNAAAPVQILGTGRPNKLLIRDYAETFGARFRVETDVELDQVEFKLLRSLLEDPTPVNLSEAVNFLHGKVDKEGTTPRERENAKKMFSAAFAVTD
jgi:hypothetical protein